MNTGEEDHARPGWTTSRRGQDSSWKSQSKWQRTEIYGENMSMVWPTLGSRTAKKQNRSICQTDNKKYPCIMQPCCLIYIINLHNPLSVCFTMEAWHDTLLQVDSELLPYLLVAPCQEDRSSINFCIDVECGWSKSFLQFYNWCLNWLSWYGPSHILN